MKTLTHVLVLAMISAPFVVSADDTASKTKTSDTSKTDTSKTDTSKTDTSKTDTSKTDASKAKPAKLKEAELQVMAHYHAVNLMEIDLGNAAAKKGTSDGVKSYGKMLVKDHGDADKQLLALAKKTAQKVPAEKPANDVERQEKAEDKAAAAKIKTMKGADFDREYLRMMVQGHEKELAKIDSKIAEVENAELADSLKALKPVLQHHADEARDLQKNLNTPSASNTNTNMPGSTPPPAKR